MPTVHVVRERFHGGRLNQIARPRDLTHPSHAAFKSTVRFPGVMLVRDEPEDLVRRVCFVFVADMTSSGVLHAPLRKDVAIENYSIRHDRGIYRVCWLVYSESVGVWGAACCMK